ncbi:MULTISPECIES: hypothetical protein [Bacillus]|nr:MULTISPECIES: hypothetical protein [Bacillus]
MKVDDKVVKVEDIFDNLKIKWGKLMIYSEVDDKVVEVEDKSAKSTIN